jgi:hypothetical protein
MRIKLLIGVLAGLLTGAASASPGLAQTYPAQASIIVPKVEVRSGPTDVYSVTSELRQGETVTVVRACKDQPGWLEIKPPKGSFCWINAKQVKQVSSLEAVVLGEDSNFVAKALVGSNVVREKPKVEAKVGFHAGTILHIVDQPLSEGGETWLPVQPDLRDVRYIPASAIAAPPTATVSATASWAVNSQATTPIPGHPSGATTDGKSTSGSTTAFSPTPAAPAAPATPNPPATTYAKQWTTYGTLQPTTFTKDGQPMYVLVGPQGQPLVYVTTTAGHSLKGYLNRTISVYGPSVYRPDDYIRTPYVVATHVAVP